MWRLAALYRAGALTPDESQAFGRALWSQRSADGGFPSGTGLPPDSFFDLPGSDPESIRTLYRARVINGNWSMTPEFLGTIIGATRLRENGARSVELSSDEAPLLFDLLTDWRPPALKFGFDQSISQVIMAAGTALASAALPFIDLKALGGERIEKVFRIAEECPVDYAVVGLPAIVNLDSSRESLAIELIRRSALKHVHETAVQGLKAIECWRIMLGLGVLGTFPEQLKQTVLTLVLGAGAPGLNSALYVATKLLSDGIWSDSDKFALASALERLHAETAYSSWSTEDPRTSTLTLVRARCVRLADGLRSAGVVNQVIARWIEEAKGDPLPEVRYSLDEADE